VRPRGGTGAVTVAKAYRLLRTILGTAVEDRLIRTNPCRIKGAAVEKSPERPVLTVAEVYALADAMPKRFRLLVLLATFCSMRWGELAELRRRDVDAEAGFVLITRGVVELVDGSLLIGGPKTAAGRRVVAIPGALLDDIREHLEEFTGPGGQALIFTGFKGTMLRRSNFQTYWTSALRDAGLRDVHFHDLRHTGNTLAAQSGAHLWRLAQPPPAAIGHATGTDG
jgi:integrase